MTTFIVDDEPFMLSLLARHFSSLGVGDLRTFERAEEARAALGARMAEVELIVCDLQMPGVDGVEFVRHLAEAGYAGDLLLVSGEDDRTLATAERLARARQLRVLAALQKPVSRERLREVLASRRPAEARKSGSADIVIDPEEIRLGIERDQFFNAYQPKVDLVTGAVVGVETLVRWAPPTLGQVPPDRFIRVAERAGLISSITEGVLSRAIGHARAWADEGVGLCVAVNVSTRDLVQLDFPERVVAWLAHAGVPTSRLTLEVTESGLVGDGRAPMDVLTRLRLKRIQLSIDDFGTGHSSLERLRDVPFDELKIDRGFVHGAARSPALRAICQSNLRLARDLAMKVVAEGVEDQADWDFLRGIGCDFAQGYFIAKPMAPELIVGWTAEWERRRPDLVRDPQEHDTRQRAAGA